MAEHGSLHEVAAGFVAAGEALGNLLSERADLAARTRKDAGGLRSKAIGLLGRLREDLVKEVTRESTLPRDLETRVFGFIDLLAAQSAARNAKKGEPGKDEGKDQGESDNPSAMGPAGAGGQGKPTSALLTPRTCLGIKAFRPSGFIIECGVGEAGAVEVGVGEISTAKVGLGHSDPRLQDCHDRPTHSPILSRRLLVSIITTCSVQDRSGGPTPMGQRVQIFLDVRSRRITITRMSVVIITVPGDIHAHGVQWALEHHGHACQRWFPSDMEAHPATARLTNAGAYPELAGPDGPIDAKSIRTVWLRRFRLPALPESMLPGDRIVARRETESFLRGFRFTFPHDIFWVNSPTVQQTALLKTAQLVTAIRVGLRIPCTIMTNDVEVARSFVRSIRGRTIYKGFLPAVWVGEGIQHNLQTVIVREEDFADPQALRLSPGIFQEFIPKQYELRVTIFGRTCIAARITEQDEVDWRPSTEEMHVDPYGLPKEIESKLFTFMDMMGLVMGTLDLIVTPEGEVVFLEVNEQGQFLWIESKNPEITLLDPFARFLAAADPMYCWPAEAQPGLTFVDYLSAPAERQFAAEELKRMPQADALIVPDE